MNEPTQEQIKEFWKQCGFEDVGSRDKFKRLMGIKYPDGTIHSAYPPIDLNNLFKYAAPKLPTTCDMYLSIHWEKPGYYTCTIQDIHTRGFRPIFITGTNPALALFWALWQVRKEVTDE